MSEDIDLVIVYRCEGSLYVAQQFFHFLLLLLSRRNVPSAVCLHFGRKQHAFKHVAKLGRREIKSLVLDNGVAALLQFFGSLVFGRLLFQRSEFRTLLVD